MHPRSKIIILTLTYKFLEHQQLEFSERCFFISKHKNFSLINVPKNADLFRYTVPIVQPSQ